MFRIESKLDVHFSLDNLKLLHRIISDEVLLKLEAIHIYSSSHNRFSNVADIISENSAEQIGLINDIFRILKSYVRL